MRKKTTNVRKSKISHRNPLTFSPFPGACERYSIFASYARLNRRSFPAKVVKRDGLRIGKVTKMCEKTKTNSKFVPGSLDNKNKIRN